MEAKLLTADRFVDSKTGCSYRYIYSDTETFRPHYHDYFEIFLMLDGSATHKVNGCDIRLSRGSLVFIRPADCHDYVCDHGKLFSMLNITISAETVHALFAYLGEGFPSRQLLQAQLPPEVSLTDMELERICRRMNNIRSIDPGNHESRKSALRILLFDLLTRHFSDFREFSPQMPAWLEEMCTQVKKDGNFSLGTEYFIGLSGKSREHVTRTLKKYTGMTPSEYINALRLNYIANMLRNSNHSIAEIIFASGFNNISWASQLFKEKYSISMRDYRSGIKNGD